MEFGVAHYLAGAGFLLLVGAFVAFIAIMRSNKKMRDEVMCHAEMVGDEVAAMADDVVDDVKRMAEEVKK